MLAPNSVLQERYRILEMIGHGGMGAVYKAIDERLGNTVAVKQTFLNDEEMGRAFEREARLLANLSHPSLPRVTDHFVEAGGQFLIMEYIPGDDLARQLKQRGKPIDYELVLEWGNQILDVLDYLHGRQPPIIHRDIKPQNLKLNDRGRIVLLDFGLAKGAPQLANLDASSIFGYTLNYAPLEQVQHSGSEQRSDLFSLGATLYHLMTATPPLGSLTRAAAIVNGDPDPLQSPDLLNPRVPPSVARAIMRSMSLRLNDRPIGARAMREALDEAQRSESGATPNAYSFSAADQLQPSRAYAAQAPIAVDPSEAPTRLIERVHPPAIRAPSLLPEKADEVRFVALLKKGFSRLIQPWLLTPVLLLALLVLISLTMKFSKPLVPRPTAEEKAPGGPPGSALAVPALSLSPKEAPIVEDGIVMLRWSPVEGAVEYVVETRNFHDFFPYTISSRTKDTFYGLRLTVKTEDVRVTAIGADRTSSSSRWQRVGQKQFQMLQPLPKLLRNTEAQLRWWPVLGAVRYEIHIADSDQETIGVIAETGTNVLRFRIPVEAFYIRIDSVFEGGRVGANSGWIKVDPY